MKSLLVVETSPRGDYSISRNMTRAFLDDWLTRIPDCKIIKRDLTTTDLRFVDLPWLQAYFTPAERHSDEMKEVMKLSDELVGELVNADHIVIATPVYNYNVPAALKAWIDHIVRRGVTLGVDGKGLLDGKNATVLLASGGVYTEGSPIRDRDMATAYLRLVLNMIGVRDMIFVAGGGSKVVDLRERTVSDFVDGLRPQLAEAVQLAMAGRPKS